MFIAHVQEIVELIFSFLEESDRKRSEQVSLTFHEACNAVEEREMVWRLQFEEKALHNSIHKGLCHDDSKHSYAHHVELIMKQLDDFEKKQLNFKIPFHVRMYMKHSKIYPSNDAIPYIPKLNNAILHPFMCIFKISQWQVRDRDCVVIGEYQTRKIDKYLVLLKNSGGKGVLEVERHFELEYHHLDSENFVSQLILQVSRMETFVVGSLTRWLSNFGYLKDQNKCSVVTQLKTSYPNALIYDEDILSDNPKFCLEYFVANFKQGYVYMYFYNLLKERQYRALLKHKIITLEDLPAHIRNDEKVISFSVATNGINLKHLTRAHHNDRDLVLEAVKENGLALAFASKTLKNLDPFIFSQANQNNQLVQYFSDRVGEETKLGVKPTTLGIAENDDFIDQFKENLQRGIYGWGIEHLTQFQRDIIQSICDQKNRNILIEGPCASGKTIASIIGVLNKGLDDSSTAPPDQVQCLIICPTKEMVYQIQLFFTSLCEYMSDISIGNSTCGWTTFYSAEFAKSYRVLIGTPGRIAHKSKYYLELSHVKTVIFEGSDQLLAGEFGNELNLIFKKLSNNCQSILISSLFSPKLIMRIAKIFTNENFKVLRVPLLPSNQPHKYQFLELTNEEEKWTLIKEIIQDHSNMLTMVFCNSRRKAEMLCEELNNVGFCCNVLHGDIDCQQRELILNDFRKGAFRPVFDVPPNIHHSITENVAFDNSKKPPQLKKAKKNQKTPQKLQADKSMKIHLYPNEQERTTLNQWMGTARWIYNKRLEFTHNFKDVKKNKKNFRTFVVNNDNYQTENQGENQAPQHSGQVVALDPGVRTFQTTFDLNGYSTKWGSGGAERIGRLCCAYDKLQSKWSQPEVRHCKRYKYKRAGRRIQQKIRNIVDDLHKKLCLWLCRNYQVILLPSFETQKMVKKLHRRINSKTARKMLTWSHYRFKQRLLHKAREYPWTHIYIVNEAYTSKTCSCCGHIHTVGSSEVFRCPSCGSIFDRDINAARNILLRFLTTHRISF
ncbi:hypothetical protein C9374_005668 [Naegleria lovaniensis]|uniref:Helicase ATP-binding domain-containing protein n=1 Tax=Naegleria lovaniensis TaxID=51637 RepID=A0AA88KMV6_NAELO|nr:uncharacterized protein C9374_005668 [Naegleria lovaniensis]KAG2381876.1 hypothetical protein C9374_005668 [Naegleria lovaniensis]